MNTITRKDQPIDGYQIMSLIYARQAKQQRIAKMKAKIKAVFIKPKKQLGDTGFIQL